MWHLKDNSAWSSLLKISPLKQKVTGLIPSHGFNMYFSPDEIHFFITRFFSIDLFEHFFLTNTIFG